MAIVQCPDCGKDVSTTAVSCPHCGFIPAPVAPPPRRRNGGCVPAVLLGLGLVVGIFILTGQWQQPETALGRKRRGRVRSFLRLLQQQSLWHRQHPDQTRHEAASSRDGVVEAEDAKQCV